jgi:Protein of unknown function (DUF1592)/Protein of unknown function (DUF1588)/Protein of unknown function (DUF1585)/Protein of unknown function (DUF1587)/Protein of unknown function (DUF1595)/Planctomycete cytochrome C
LALGCVGSVGHIHATALQATASWTAFVQPTVELQTTQAPSGPIHQAVSARRALVDKYCVGCHNARLRTAGLALDIIDAERVGKDAPVWERVVRKLNGGTMPPPGQPRPDPATFQSFRSSLEAELDEAAAGNPNPGRTTLHRLNRFEYANVIHDLLGLEINTLRLLPTDEEQFGFDNIAAALAVSPTLLERYLASARRISQLAVGDPALRPVFETYPISLIQDDQTSDDVPFGARGVSVRHYFPLDGEYEVQVGLKRQIYGYIRGVGRPHRMEVRVDGEPVTVFPVGRTWQLADLPRMGNAGRDIASSEWEEYAQHADEAMRVRFPTRAGMHSVTIAFDKKPGLLDGALDVPVNRASFNYSADEMQEGNPAAATVTIGGPFNAEAPRETPSRRTIFVCAPKVGRAEEERCARRILATLVRRAYRRPATSEDVAKVFRFYESGRAAARPGALPSFDAGIQAALEYLLVSPEFLFRIESDPTDVAPGAPYRITDLELASRLSFFLWSSIPDDELIDAAARGSLGNPQGLEAQVRRMLADPRSKRFAGNFGGQWLQYRNIKTAAPDTAMYPAFNDNLRNAMFQETQLFVENQLAEDRSVMELLTANYTFLNEQLARHYGISNVYGNQFRRVTLPDDTRGGILGHGSILTVTSYATRTSPVVRAKWLLDNILGAPPPDPPPNVPALAERTEPGKAHSLRERLEQHRRNPTCAACHNVMDPWGFALESYDAIGRWRTNYEVKSAFETAGAIDSLGALPDGTRFNGPAELRNVLRARQDQFITTVVGKLLTYALGRGLDYYDMPTLRRIKRDTAASNHRWSAIILEIVKCKPFQMRLTS